MDLAIKKSRKIPFCQRLVGKKRKNENKVLWICYTFFFQVLLVDHTLQVIIIFDPILNGVGYAELMGWKMISYLQYNKQKLTFLMQMQTQNLHNRLTHSVFI